MQRSVRSQVLKVDCVWFEAKNLCVQAREAYKALFRSVWQASEPHFGYSEFSELPGMFPYKNIRITSLFAVFMQSLASETFLSQFVLPCSIPFLDYLVFG